MENARTTAPQTVSLNFTAGRRLAGLLRDAHGLHRGAEVGVGLRHELGEVVRALVQHAEAAARHEVRVLLAAGDLLDRSDELVPRLGREVLRRRDAAPGAELPV